MGIKGLTQLLYENAPACITFRPNADHLRGKKVPQDASMLMYQSLAGAKAAEHSVSAALASGNGGGGGGASEKLDTKQMYLSNLVGRILRIRASGILPLVIFDGAPPPIKERVIKERRSKCEQAEQKLMSATSDEEIARLSKMSVKPTPENVADFKRALDLLGIPWLQAPGEAEAQAAVLAARGQVHGVSTEDADALAFGCPVLIRQLGKLPRKKNVEYAKIEHKRKQDTMNEETKENENEYMGKPRAVKPRINVNNHDGPVEIRLDVALIQLGLTMAQFRLLCLLLGCDYSGTIKGIGPVRALELVRKYGTLEEIFANEPALLENVKVDDWHPKEALLEFENPSPPCLQEVPPATWACMGKFDEKGLKTFFCKERGFSEKTVQRWIERSQAANKGSGQTRLDAFFKMPERPLTEQFALYVKPQKPKVVIKSKPKVTGMRKKVVRK